MPDQHRDGIVITAKAEPALGHVIGANHIQFFPLQLAFRVSEHLLSLRCKADTERPIRPRRNLGQDVRILDQLQFQLVAGLFDFLRRDAGQPVIRHGRAADENGAAGNFVHYRRMHFGGAVDIEPAHTGRGRHTDRAGHQNHLGAGSGGGFGQGITHLA